jgi:quinoprotein glucose dehydrogenase
MQSAATIVRLVAVVILLASACARPAGVAARGETSREDSLRARLDVAIVTDEADAVLALLDRRASGVPFGDELWQRVVESEGYRRLADRERAFNREITDSAFRAFVLSDTLVGRLLALRRTLRDWKRVDPLSAALRAFDYLPDEARIRARIYPAIKPRGNSFVWETETNPAIFLYLDPDVSVIEFERTLAHELHHIGVADACRAVDSSLAPGLRSALEWMSGFAEGRAVLAAAGGADVHPHATSDAAERAVWDRDIAQAAADVRRLEAFFVDVLDEKLSPQERTRRGFTFIATDSVPQGAFYTVGWLMASTIERELGRDTLVRSTCDPRRFLADYHRAAARARSAGRGASLPLFSDALLARLSGVAAPPPHAPATEWRAYGYDALGSRFSPLTDIHRENVGALTVAWTYRTGEPLPSIRRRSLETTPIVVNGVMYLATPLGKVIALDPVTGRQKWAFDARVPVEARFGDFASRGVSHWQDRILYATVDARLVALDTANGRPITSFGSAGVVNLRHGLHNAPQNDTEYEVTSPPAIVGDLVVVGSAVADNGRTDAASGEVRAFDARTGALRWSWDPVPRSASDPAYRTWAGPNAHRTGAANAWSVIAADPERDMVYVPTGSPSPDYFGGERLGRNDYANSIVALRASTGQVVWHFQTVHHDLWDYDNASPPLLATVRGRPAVIQTTKTGMMFVLDRETGAPIFPVEERRVPASTVPGETAWPTQPFSALPALSPHSWNPTSASAACHALLRGLRNEGIFTPPSLEGTLVLPSNVGGAHWGGLAFDPARQIAVVPVNRLAAMVQLIPADGANLDSLREQRSRIGFEDTRMRGTPYIMRRKILFMPPADMCVPWAPGALVAIDLRSGTKAWETPLPPQLGGPIITAGGLVFMAATMDSKLRAFDIETGRELWNAALPGGGKATPMTYRGADGRQYVTIAAGGDGETWQASDAIVTFAIPRRASTSP